MIDAVIIEDKLKPRALLKSLIKDYCPDVDLRGEADSVETGLQLIKKLNPLLVFLDVELGDGSAFDLLTQLPEKNFHIIFTTAYDHYALRAIKFSAIDYLLKPVNSIELKAAVEKVKMKSSAGVAHDSISLLIKNLSEGSGKPPEKIALPTGNGHVFININDIIRFEAEGSYTYVFLTTKEKITVSRNLKEFENFIDENNFVRIHRSHFINLRHVKNYIKGSGGFVVMTDSSKLEVSVRKKEEFLKKMHIR